MLSWGIYGASLEWGRNSTVQDDSFIACFNQTLFQTNTSRCFFANSFIRPKLFIILFHLYSLH